MPVISKLSPKFDLNTLAGFAAILLWSTTIAVVRSLSEQVGGLTTAASVYLVGGVICLLRLGWRGDSLRNFRRLPLRYLFGCGALFVFYMLVLYLAVGMAKNRQQVLEVGLMNYLWPALTIVFSVFLLNKKAGPLLFPAPFWPWLESFSLSARRSPFPGVLSQGILPTTPWLILSRCWLRFFGPSIPT